MSKKKAEEGDRRFTVGFAEGIANEMDEQVTKEKKFKSNAELIRHAVRQYLAGEREQKTATVRGLVATLEGSKMEVDNKTLDEIKKALGIK